MNKYIDLATEVIRSGIHLADSYEDYTKLAFSLSTLGEQGRSIFHSLCSYCDNYKAKDADRKFTEALRSNRSYSIATFVWMCKQASVNVKRFGLDSDNYIPMQQSPKHQHQREIGHIPFSYVEKSASYNSSFVQFLCGLFDRYSLESPTIERLMQDYALGATKDGSVIYWQIDTKGRVRTGKVMKYNPETGHRLKDAGGINWIHSIMKKQNLLPENYNLVQCLFGEHLLRMYPNKVVALVESEKSALIASGVYPDYVWLATGGKSQLSINKLKTLKGRTVIMFPDVDSFEYWTGKAKEVEAIGCKVIVSDLLEKNATDEDRINKIDIADWLIRYLSNGAIAEVCNELSETEKILQSMIEANPALQTLINTFNLELVA